MFLPSSQLDATDMMRPGSGLLLRFSADKIRWSDNGRPRRSGLPRDMIVGIHAFSCYSYIATICVLHPRYYKPGNTTTTGFVFGYLQCWELSDFVCGGTDTYHCESTALHSSTYRSCSSILRYTQHEVIRKRHQRKGEKSPRGEEINWSRGFQRALNGNDGYDM